MAFFFFGQGSRRSIFCTYIQPKNGLNSKTQNNKATMTIQNNREMKKSNTVTATSPMAMGKALVLTLATVGSCAALSGGGVNLAGAGSTTCRRIETPRTIPQRRRSNGRRLSNSNGGGPSFHSIVALYYRETDEDQSSSMRAANQSAVDSTITTARVATPTRRHDGNHNNNNMFTINPFTMLPTSAKATPTKEDKEQLAMDQYLEYVERRYSRLTPKHKKQQTHQRIRPKVILDMKLPRKIFMSTLTLHRLHLGQPMTQQNKNHATNQQQPSSSSTTVVNNGYEAAAARQQQASATDEEKDALNALGLSSLASARLRQRLHVPRDLRDEHMLLTSGTTSAVNLINYMVHLNDLPLSSSKAASTLETEDVGGRTSIYTSLSFTAQFKLLIGTLQKLSMAFVNTLRILSSFGKRMFTEILDKGGFRHSVRMMSVVPLAIILMFRPLFRGMMKQG